MFFDVGANLGWFTLLGDRICTLGEVHSFEMDPKLGGLLLDTLGMNSLLAPHFTNNMALVGKNSKVVTFSPHQAGNPSTNQAYRESSGEDEVRVGGISLEEYCEATQRYPTFIKLDIEGGELEAIKGMQRILKEKAPKVALEVHPQQIREQGGAPQELVSFILQLVPSYNVFWLKNYRKSGDELLVPFPEGFEWGDRPEVLYFCSPA